MARIVNQKFEGTGYDNGESWTEGVGAGCTVDEDASPGDVSQPDFWDRQCLKIVKAASVNGFTYVQQGETAIQYTRIEFVITDHTIAEGLSAPIVLGLNGIGSQCWQLLLYRSSGVYYLLIFAELNGVDWTADVGPAYSLNTRYRVDVKWDTTNHLFQWWVDDVDQGSAALTAGHYIQGIVACGDPYANAGAYTAYYDLVAVDNADRIGSEGQPAVKRYAGVPFKYLNKGVW